MFGGVTTVCLHKRKQNSSIRTGSFGSADRKMDLQPAESLSEISFDHKTVDMSSNMDVRNGFSSEEYNIYSRIEMDYDKYSSIHSSETDSIKELNNRLANFVKINQTLEEENRSLRISLESFKTINHESSYVGFKQERKCIAENDMLEIENSNLKQKIKRLETRLDMETKMNVEAKKQIEILLDDNEARSLEIQKLKQNIKRLSETTTVWQTWSKRQDEWRKITGIAGDTVDGPGIDLKKLRDEIFAGAERKVTKIEAFYKYKMEEWQKKINDKETELVEARQQNEKFYLQNQKYICKIKSLTAEIDALNARIHNLEEFRGVELISSQDKIKNLEKQIKTLENEVQCYFQSVEGLKSTKAALEAEITTYRNLLEVLESRIKSSGLRKSLYISEGSFVSEMKTEIKTEQYQAYSSQEEKILLKSSPILPGEISGSQLEETENQEGDLSEGKLKDKPETASEDSQEKNQPLEKSELQAMEETESPEPNAAEEPFNNGSEDSSESEAEEDEPEPDDAEGPEVD
ncbi:vimentin isoform X3 [Fundulus heteroclitus]|uniref:vimentin isoform X3 n=1 Tax=Fundulus heteroclitus TaxID=8078 RepID=UPI00165C5706|nr:vimentin isoform X3 [Fundulus heteroclitus]